jgi:hypothetical protein
MFDLIPSEVPLGEMYLPPALLVGLLGIAATWFVTRVLNRTRLTRFFWNPPLAFMAIWALMSAVIGLFVLSP